MKIDKKKFESNLMEEQIYQELRDCPMKNSTYIAKKYQGTGIDVYRLYRRIVNYQIRTYGEQLCSSDVVRRLDKEGLRRDKK